jgi:uncharacterized protein GlcG (DUF336 family)
MKHLFLAAAPVALISLALHANATGLPLGQALVAAQAAVSACKASGYNVTVTIMDPDLSPRIVLRADGAPAGTVQIAYRKAYTVIKMGMSSGDFGKTVPAPPSQGQPQGPPGPVNGDPNLITWAGGLPITVAGAQLGSMSVSGAPTGDKDEACVKAGLAKIAT